MYSQNHRNLAGQTARKCKKPWAAEWHLPRPRFVRGGYSVKDRKVRSKIYCSVLGASLRLCTMPYQRQFVCVLRSTSLNLVTPEPLMSALKTLYIVLPAGLAGKT